MNLKKIHVYAVVLGKSLYEGILDISSVKKYDTNKKNNTMS